MPVYRWQSNFQQYHTAGQHHDEIAIGFVPPDEKLKRVVLYWKVWLNQPESDVLATWLSWGVLSIVQWTFGSPIPIPDDVGLGDFDTRDILDSQWTTPVRGQLLNDLLELPGPPGTMGHHDVAPTRSAPVTGGAVWWCWGLPTFAGGGVELGHGSYWARVLTEFVGT